MANETLRIFFPLKIVTYPQDEYGVEDNPVEITPAEAVSYEDAILAAIAKENRLFENDRGPAEYIHDDSFNEKVYSLYWGCENRLKNGTKNCRHSPALKEEVLREAIMTAINSVVENRVEFVGAFRENVIRVIGSYSTKNVPTEYDGQIEKLQGDMLALIDENAKRSSIMEDFDEQHQRIAEQIRDLKQKKLELVREQKMAASFQQRIEDMDACLKKTTCEVREFDNDLVRKLLQNIKVVNDELIEIQFKSGIVMNQRVSYFD